MSNIPHRIYATAVTAGLTDDFATARRLFKRIEELDAGGFAPHIELKAECAKFNALLDDAEAFRSALKATIDGARQRLRLPPDPQCLEVMDAIAAR